MTYNLTEPHNGKTIEIPDNSVVILIGKNGSGKSKILQRLRTEIAGSIFLRGNYETVQDIQTINMATSEGDQVRNDVPVLASSIVASNPELLKIFQFYFKSLFDIELKVDNNYFVTNSINISQEADGLKSLFNLSYYLLSPHKVLLLDEPERFFHPSLSSLFLSLISEIATNYGKKIVITTHTPELMRFDLKNVVIYRISKNPSIIFNVNNWITPITSTKYHDAKSIQAFKDWFYFHSDIVFSKHAIMVEGYSDSISLDALKQKLSFEYRLEDVSIKPVASSHHESGGKSRLHKMQTFLNSLIPTYSIADKDIIGPTLTNWFPYVASDSEAKIISDAKSHNLLILPKGELEDYYFTDPSYDYCQSATMAKQNKIPAAYEQARIILSKSFSEVAAQFDDLVIFLKSVINHIDSANDPLKSLAKDYLIEKHLRKGTTSVHLRDMEDGDKIRIRFNFTPSTREYSITKESISKVEQIGDEIENGLNR